MQFRELNEQEFIGFTNNFPLKSIYQTLEYGLVMQKQNYQTFLLGLLNNNTIVAATLILVKKE